MNNCMVLILKQNLYFKQLSCNLIKYEGDPILGFVHINQK